VEGDGDDDETSTKKELFGNATNVILRILDDIVVPATTAYVSHDWALQPLLLQTSDISQKCNCLLFTQSLLTLALI
jgi:hypothetical protein